MKTRLHSGGARRGIMLMEALVYIAVLVLVLGCGGALLYQSLSGNIALRRNADDITRALYAGELWRADVRAATGRMTLRHGESVHIPAAKGEIVYEFLNETITRTASGQPPRVLTRVKSSHMQQDQRAKGNAWRWELELNHDGKNTRYKPLFTFEAVAGTEANK